MSQKSPTIPYETPAPPRRIWGLSRLHWLLIAGFWGLVEFAMWSATSGRPIRVWIDGPLSLLLGALCIFSLVNAMRARPEPIGLQQIELVMNVEDEFGIVIGSADDYGQSVSTVGAFHDLVLRLVRANPTSELAQRPDLEQHAWTRIAAMAADCGNGLKREQVTRETRFIEDLGYC